MCIATLRFAAFIPLMICAPLTFAEFTASLGIQAAELQVSSETTWHNFTPGFTYEGLDSDEDTGVSGEAAIGYRYQINDHYAFDLDLFGQINDAETDVPVVAGGNDLNIPNATASFDWLWGLRIRPGYQITETTRLFIDGGLVWGIFDIDYSDQTLVLTDLDDDDRKGIYGWRYGVGLEYAFTDFCVVSMDYASTAFQDFDSDSIATANEGGSGMTSYTPTLYTLGLNFKVFFGEDWF